MLRFSPFPVLHLEFSFIEVNPFPAMWSSWFLDCEDSARCLVDSWDALNSHTLFWNSSRMQFRASQTPSWCYLVMGLSSFLLSFFQEFPKILWHLDQWSKFISFFEHCRAPVSLLPILVFLDSERRYQFSSILTDHNLGLVVVWIFVILLPDTHVSLWSLFFSFNRVNVEKPLYESDKLLSRVDIPIIVNPLFL